MGNSGGGPQIDTHEARQAAHQFNMMDQALRDNEHHLMGLISDLLVDPSAWAGPAAQQFESAWQRLRRDTLLGAYFQERTGAALFQLADRVEQLRAERSKAIAAGVGLGILTAGLFVINVLQLGLDPVTDSADVAAGGATAADIAALSEFLALMKAIDLEIARQFQEILFQAEQAGNVVGFTTQSDIPTRDLDPINMLLELEDDSLGILAARQQDISAAEQQERNEFISYVRQDYPQLTPDQINSMLNANLSQAEIMQLLDGGFLTDYAALFKQTPVTNPGGADYFGVIASMAFAHISPNMITDLHLLDEAHIQAYITMIQQARDAGQYVSIGDVASLYAAGFPLDHYQQLLDENFFGQYGDLIEVYGAGWLAKIRWAYRGRAGQPQTATYQSWFAQLTQIQDIPGSWVVARDLATGPSGAIANANKRFGAQFALQWLAANSDTVAAAEVSGDSKQGADALLTSGTLVEFKSYQDISRHSGDLLDQLNNRYLPYAQAHGITQISYVFDAEFGPAPQTVIDALVAAGKAKGIQVTVTSYMPPTPRDNSGGFG